MAFERLPWDPDVWYTDVHMFRQPEFGSVYLIDDEKTALVETGTSNDVTAILAALKEFDRNPAEVDALVVSHVHLDHAGGAGFLLEAMPNATVYVHERGAKHLADPSRLVASAKEALQDMAEEFGTMRPVRPDRLVAVKDGDTLDLGSRVLTFRHSTGHAPHELTIEDGKSRCIFTGDEAGLWFPRDRLLMPVTPPPSFDLARNLESFTEMLAYAPRALLFSHFGPHTEPRHAIEAQMQGYATWASLVRARRKENHEEDTIVQELFDRHCKGAEFYPERFLKNRIQNSVHGLVVYHQRLEDAAPRG
jgi:glyoxylase-like metal-dependent hydrolase (beta-lactamase superfamily II)